MLQHMSTSSTNLKSTNKVQPHVSCVSCRRVTLTWQEDSQWSSPQSPPNNNSKSHLFATIKWLLHFVVLPLASCSFRVKQKSRRGWLSFKKGCCNFVGGNHWNRLYNRYHEYYITNNHTVFLYIEYLIVAEKSKGLVQTLPTCYPLISLDAFHDVTQNMRCQLISCHPRGADGNRNIYLKLGEWPSISQICWVMGDFMGEATLRCHCGLLVLWIICRSDESGCSDFSDWDHPSDHVTHHFWSLKCWVLLGQQFCGF